MAVTLEPEVSPRRLDLVGVNGVLEILTENGRVNRKTGKPLTITAVWLLIQRDPTFPKPYLDKATGSSRRLWRRADVEKWIPTWNQKDGPKSYKADVLVKVIESQPDRIWTVRELATRLRRKREFAEIGDLRKYLYQSIIRVAQQGRIQRIGPGSYRSLPAGVEQAAKIGEPPAKGDREPTLPPSAATEELRERLAVEKAIERVKRTLNEPDDA